MSFFGNTSNTGGGANIFGSNTTNTTGSSNPPANIFGGGSFGAPATGTGNIFGSAATSTPQTGGNIFGGGNTTTTTPSSGTSSTPATAATGGNGLFNMNNTKPLPTFGGGGNIFGNSAANLSTATGTGSSTANTTTPATGGLFGGSAPSTTIPTANPLSGLFGAANTSAPATDATKTAAPSNNIFGTKPTGSNIFGQPASTSTTTPAPATTTPSLGGGLFGLPPKPATTGTTTGTTPGPSNLNLFGNPIPPKPAADTANKDTPGPATTGNGLFGSGFGATANKEATGSGLFGATANKEASGSGLFGAPANKEGEKKDSTTAPPATPAFSLFGAAKSTEKKADSPAPSTDKKETPATQNPFGTTNAPATSTAAPTVSVAIAPPSMLRGKSLEEIVNRWTSDLEANIKEFNKFAGEVSVWDRALIENGNNIAALYSHILSAERQQNEINESLDHIEGQQKELASTLDAYEKISQDILGGQSGSLRTLDTGPADSERDKNYVLATDLHTHLDDLSGSLTQMIDSVNALSISSKPAESADDPMSQISQILSSHLESLQWIDSAVREVESKTKEVENSIKDSGHNMSGGNKSRGFGLNR